MKNLNSLCGFVIGVIVMRCGWFATIPFLSTYIYNHISHDPIIVGLIIGIGYLASGMGGVISGIFIDKYDPRSVMLVALLYSFVDFIALFLINNIGLFIIMNFLIGLFGATFEVASKSYISLSYTDQDRVHAYNLRYTAINIGAALGPAIGLWFSTHAPKEMFLFSAIVYVLIFLIFRAVLSKHTIANTLEHASNSVAQILKAVFNDRRLLLLLLISTIMFIGYSQMQSTLPEVLQIDKINHYLSLYSILIIISACIVIALQVPFGLIFNKIPINVLTYSSVLLMVMAFLVFAIAKTFTLFVVSILLLSLAEIITSLVVNVLVDMISPDNMRGVYFGAINLGTMGLFFGPVIGGAILQFSSSRSLYLSLAVIVGLALPLYCWFHAAHEK